MISGTTQEGKEAFSGTVTTDRFVEGHVLRTCCGGRVCVRNAIREFATTWRTGGDRHKSTRANHDVLGGNGHTRRVQKQPLGHDRAAVANQATRLLLLYSLYLQRTQASRKQASCMSPLLGCRLVSKKMSKGVSIFYDKKHRTQPPLIKIDLLPPTTTVLATIQRTTTHPPNTSRLYTAVASAPIVCFHSVGLHARSSLGWTDYCNYKKCACSTTTFLPPSTAARGRAPRISTNTPTNRTL